MRHRTLIAILLFAAIPLQAQTLPDAPKPKPQSHKVFVMGVAALAASDSFDMQQTSALIHRGGWENNSAFGGHPSDSRIAGTASVIFGAQTAGFYLTERNRRRWVRWSGRAILALEIEEHTRLAVCDAGINVHSSQVHNCRPLLPF